MKEHKANIDIDDLFRKLEETGADPSPEAGSLLMRKLALREFMRFNLYRFNIYYAGLIAAFAATALYLVLASGVTAQPEDSTPLPLAGVWSDSLLIQAGTPVSYIQSEDQAAASEKKAQYESGRVGRTINKASVYQSVNNIAGQQVKNIPETIDSRILTSPALYKSDPAAKGLRSGSVMPESFIKTSVNSGCVPLKVSFSVNHNNAEVESVMWSFGDGGTSVEPDTEWTYMTEGEFMVILNLVLNDGTTISGTAEISVFARPTAYFEILPSNPVIPDDEIRFVNYSSGAVSYKWDFGDGDSSVLFSPVHSYRSFGTYDITLIATSEKGCSDTLTNNDAFGNTGYFIDFPNAFIPNAGGPSDGQYSWSSDEMARIFHPEYSGVAGYSLRIFSKAGMLVFETSDIHTGWDGYYKGRLSSPGVYIWKVSGTFANGEPFAKTGDLTLIRNEFK